MRFAQKNDGGHMAPRKFWRHELVRMKYHNPAVSMTVDRTAPSTDPALMTVFFAPKNAPQTSSSSTGTGAPTSSTSGDKAPSEYTPTEKTEEIPMTNRTPVEILGDLIKLTNATSVEATPEELEQLEGLNQARIKGAKDAKLSLEVREKKKREEALLAQARGEMAAQAA